MASDVPSTPPPRRRLRRVGLALLTLLVALGGFLLVLLFFESRDSSQVPGSVSGQAPGQPVAHQRTARRAAPIARDRVRLSEDQVLTALARGDVVLLYGGARTAPPAALRALQQRVSGPFDPTLAVDGAAVILGWDPHASGVVALAWRRVLRTPSASDPALEQFANYWLGRGAR